MALIQSDPVDSPDVVLFNSPCLECLSETQLRMVELFLWATKAGYIFPGELTTLLEDSKCWECVGEKRQLIGRISALASSMEEIIGTIADVQAAMACFPCLKLGQIRAATTFSFIKSLHTVL